MAYISERRFKDNKRYYLIESYRDNGNILKHQTYLGTKPPWPKSQGWTGLSLDEKRVQQALAKISKKRENRIALKSVMEDTQNLDGQNIITGDLSKLEKALSDNSVSLFFTDPPYNQESLGLFAQLGKLAKAKLAPGGLLLTYAPHPHLPIIFNTLGKYLDYWWIFSVIQSGLQPRIWKQKLWVGWKPIIVFIKPKQPSNGRLTHTWFLDSFRGSGEDKRYHKWGQDVHEATYWIEALTPVGSLIVDPFCGGGTIPLACKITGRRWFATEIDPKVAAIARQRLHKNGN